MYMHVLAYCIYICIIQYTLYMHVQYICIIQCTLYMHVQYICIIQYTLYMHVLYICIIQYTLYMHVLYICIIQYTLYMHVLYICIIQCTVVSGKGMLAVMYVLTPDAISTCCPHCRCSFLSSKCLSRKGQLLETVKKEWNSELAATLAVDLCVC